MRLELQTTTRQNRVSAGTDTLQVPNCNGDDNQAPAYNVGDMDPHPYTSTNVGVIMDKDVIMSIADAPVKLPEPSQDYYDDYQAAVLQGEELFEVRLPLYREAVMCLHLYFSHCSPIEFGPDIYQWFSK